MINFSSELNQEQLDVVLHGDGPCLVLAGAGSGKTRTATYRVAYLLEQGVAPENILLVTFTNKAASEMVERIAKITGRTERLPWAGTFHSIGHKILRAHATELGYRSNFSILDSDDSESMIKLCAKDYAITSKGKKFPSAGVLQAIISFSRNAEQAIPEVLEARYSQFEMWSDQIIEIARAYETKKLEANVMDFDDLLTNWLRLLNIPKILKQYSSQFKYILVDEYQDTNKIQSAVVKRLAQHHKNILVVGDDAQSIYSFRAADIANILQFEKDFPGAKIFKLTTNYRSSDEILKVANSVISNNPKQYKKDLKSTLNTGVKPELHPKSDVGEEAMFITDKIASLIRGGVDPRAIAVLFRAAHHSQQLELELMRAGIDYDYRGGLRFFDRSHVKDILAYLRILNNLSDTVAWSRVLLYQDGIGPMGAAKIIEAIQSAKDLDDVSKAGAQLSDRGRAGWQNFLDIWNGMLAFGKDSPSKIINFILQSSYKDYLEAERVDSAERMNDLKQLAAFAQKYDNLSDFLSEAALQEAFTLKRKQDAAKKAHEGKIVLTTIHQAKGLEWTAVFVINLSNGQFPHERAYREENGIEEERRLFYVAVTRAKKYLYFTYPMMASTPGRGYNNNWGEAMASGGPSQFLEEINPILINDKSFLRSSYTSLNDGDVQYVSEDDPTKPFNIKPGSFLRDVGDL